MNALGIDLAGSPKRKTGFCVLHCNLYCRTDILYTDSEIVERVLQERPSIVSIDAPLFLPKGRVSLDVKGPPHFRVCDRELQRMKIRFFPITLGPMRILTARGMKIRAVLEKLGFKVIESFPGAVQDILGMPRKQQGIERLRQSLIDYGIKGDIMKKDITGDELDAITSALIGKMYLDGNYTAIGADDEGFMILPRIS